MDANWNLLQRAVAVSSVSRSKLINLTHFFATEYERRCSGTNYKHMQHVFELVKCLNSDAIQVFLKQLLDNQSWKSTIFLKFKTSDEWTQQGVKAVIDKCINVDMDLLPVLPAMNISKESEPLLRDSTDCFPPHGSGTMYKGMYSAINQFSAFAVNEKIEALEADIKVEMRSTSPSIEKPEDVNLLPKNEAADTLTKFSGDGYTYAIYTNESLKEWHDSNKMYDSFTHFKDNKLWPQKPQETWTEHLEIKIDNDCGNIILIGPLFSRLKHKLIEIIEPSFELVYDFRDKGVHDSDFNKFIKEADQNIAVINIDFYASHMLQYMDSLIRKKGIRKFIHSNTGLFTGEFKGTVHCMSQCCLKYISDNEKFAMKKISQEEFNKCGGYFDKELLPKFKEDQKKIKRAKLDEIPWEEYGVDQLKDMQLIDFNQFDQQFILQIFRQLKQVMMDPNFYVLFYELSVASHYIVYTSYFQPNIDLFDSRILVSKYTDDNYHLQKNEICLRILNNLLLLNFYQSYKCENKNNVSYGYVNQNTSEMFSDIYEICQDCISNNFNSFPELEKLSRELLNEEGEKKTAFKKFIVNTIGYFENLPLKRVNLNENTVNAHFLHIFKHFKDKVQIDNAMPTSRSRPDLQLLLKSVNVAGELKRNKTLKNAIQIFYDRGYYSVFHSKKEILLLCGNFINNSGIFEIGAVFRNSDNFIFASSTKDDADCIHFTEINSQ